MRWMYLETAGLGRNSCLINFDTEQPTTSPGICLLWSFSGSRLVVNRNRNPFLLDDVRSEKFYGSLLCKAFQVSTPKSIHALKFRQRILRQSTICSLQGLMFL